MCQQAGTCDELHDSMHVYSKQKSCADTQTCLATAFAKSLLVSVLPVPAGPSGAPPRFSFNAPIRVLHKTVSLEHTRALRRNSLPPLTKGSGLKFYWPNALSDAVKHIEHGLSRLLRVGLHFAWRSWTYRHSALQSQRLLADAIYVRPVDSNCLYQVTGSVSTFGRRAFSGAGPTVWNSLYQTVSDTRLSAAAASGNYLRQTSSTVTHHTHCSRDALWLCAMILTLTDTH